MLSKGTSGVSASDLERTDYENDADNGQTQSNSQQLSSIGGRERDVRKIVWCQISVGETDYEYVEHSKNDIIAARDYLRRVSATEIPPALASFAGFGTEPFLLYKSVGFDRLHLVDLVVARTLPDLSFYAFSEFSYNKGQLTKTELVRLANRSFNDLKNYSKVYIPPFLQRKMKNMR